MLVNPFDYSKKEMFKRAKEAADRASEISTTLNLNEPGDLFSFFPTMEERLAAVNVHLRKTDAGAAGTVEAAVIDGKIKFRIPILDIVYDDVASAFEDLAEYRLLGIDLATHRSKLTDNLLSQAGYTSNLTNRLGGVSEIEQVLNEKIAKILGTTDTGTEEMKNLKNMLEGLSKHFGQDGGELKYDFSKGVQLRILNFGDELALGDEGDLLSARAKRKRSIGSIIAEKRKTSNALAGSVFVDDKTNKILQMTIDGKIVDSYTTEMLLAITDDEILDPAKISKILKSGDSTKVMATLQKIIKRAKGIVSDRPISLAGNELIEFLAQGSDEIAKQLRSGLLSPQEARQLALQKVYLGDKSLTMFEKYAFGGLYDYNIDLASEGGLFESYGKSFNPLATAQMWQDVNPDDYFGRILEAYEEGLFEVADSSTTKLDRTLELDRLRRSIIEHNRLMKEGHFGNQMHKAGGKSLQDFLSGGTKISKQQYRKLGPETRSLYKKVGNEYVSKEFNSSLIENLFLSVETAADGSTIGNTKFFQRVAKTNTAEYIRENFPTLKKYIELSNTEGMQETLYEELESDIARYANDKANSMYHQELIRLRSSLEKGDNLSLIDRKLKHLDEIAQANFGDQKLIELSSSNKLAQQILEEQSRLESLRRTFLLAAEHDQVTARGNFPGLGNIKSIYRNIPLEGELSQYAVFLDEFDIKSELGFGRESLILNFSGIGGHREAVAVDQLMTIFHGEIFENKEARAMRDIEKRRVINEIQEIFKTGKIPDKILEEIDMQAAVTDAEIAGLDAAKRPGALKNRMIAREVQTAIMSTSNPSEHPAVINQIFRMYSQELYAIDFANQRVSPVDSTLKRVTLNTELQALSGDPIRKPFLGRGSTQVAGITVSDKAAEMLRSKGINSLDEAQNIFGISEDMFKFRSVGHALLFGGDTVGVFRHALGGMDLDDKGLPKLATYIDKDGIRKFMMPLLRQPTSLEEIVYGIPAMDVETIFHMFAQDEDNLFMTHLDQLIQERQLLNEASLMAGAGRSEDVSGLLRLKGILGLDKSGLENFIKEIPGELENADQVRQAIIDVYDLLEKNKHISVMNISDKPKIVESLIRYGSSPLAVKDLAAEPQYSRPGVFKIFEEAGAFDFSRPVSEALTTDINAAQRRAAIPEHILLKIDQALGLPAAERGDAVLEVMGEHFDNPTIRELFGTTFNIMELTKVTDTAEQAAAGAVRGVGGSVNILTVVGGTRDWFEESLRNLPEAQAKFILDNFQIGQLSSETFIDLSIGFAAERQLASSQKEHIFNIIQALNEGSYYGNEEGMAKALYETLYGKQKAVLREGVFSLDEIVGSIISATGRQIGATLRFTGEQKFIDTQILLGRLMGEDVDTFLASISQGIEESYDLQISQMQSQLGKINPRHVRKIANLQSQINALEAEKQSNTTMQKIAEIQREAIESPVMSGEKTNIFATQKRTQKRLVEMFGLDPEHEFAYLGGQQKQLAETMSELDRMKRNALANAYKKQTQRIEYFAGETTENIQKARKLAENIIEGKKPLLEAVFKMGPEEISQLSPAQVFNFNIASEAIARDVYHGIAVAAQSENMTAEIMINAVEEYLSTAFLDEKGNRTVTKIPDLLNISPSILESGPSDSLMSEMYKQITLTRELRNIKKYSAPEFAAANRKAKEIFDRMHQLKSTENIQDLRNQAKQILESGHYRNIDGSISQMLEGDRQILSRLALEALPEEVSDDVAINIQQVAEAMIARHQAETGLKEYIDLEKTLTTRGTAKTAEEIRQDFARIYSDLIGQAEPGAQASAMSVNIPPRVQQIVDEIAQGAEDVSRTLAEGLPDPTLPNYKRFNFGEVRQLWSRNKLFKGTAVTTAVAISGSLVYRHFRDRSNDDMKGPPLLPGGSAYEKIPSREYPGLAYVPQEYKPGLSYNVSVQGSPDDISRFNEAARGLTNGPIDTTIYNTIPSVTDDPYSKLASSY